MARLIKADLATAGKANNCEGSPARFFYPCTRNILFLQSLDSFAQVVAHQIERPAQQVGSAMLLPKVTVSGMHRQFGRRHGKDQPIMAEVYRAQLQNVTEECAVGFGVFAID